MSRDLFDVKEQYIGTGGVSAYTFDFKIEALTQLLVVVYDTSVPKVEVQRVDGTDAVFLSSVTFDPINGGGTVNLQANLTNLYTIQLLLANDAPTQPYSFKNKTDFTMKRIEAAFDFIAGAIQRVAYLAQRSIKVSDLTPSASFDPTLPTALAGSLSVSIGTNATGDGMAMGPTFTEIANAQQYAIDALASADAADVSEANAAASAAAAAVSAALAQQSIRLENQTLAVGNGVTTSFGPLDYTPMSEESVLVMLDGVSQTEALWSLSTLNIVFSTAPAAGQEVSVYYARFGTGVIPLGAYTIGGSIGSPVVVPATPAIIPPATAFHRMFVSTAAGAITVTANPQIAAGTILGQTLKLNGTSDANYPVYNDGNGLRLNGALQLKQYSSVELYWDGATWTEDSRR